MKAIAIGGPNVRLIVALIVLVLLRCLAMLRNLTADPNGIAVPTRTETGLLLVPTTDAIVDRMLCFGGRYDTELRSFLLEKCEPRAEVLVVGAHVGALVVPVAKRVRRVVAVEANPSICELLRMNVELNKLQNVEIHNFAAGDKNDKVSFLTCYVNSGAGCVEMGGRREEAYVYGKPEKITILMKKLDEVFPDPCFDVIVMDLEGAEPLALRGMGNLLKHSHGLLVEVFERHLRRIARVSNEEFLALVCPYFDEAFILPEKPRPGEAVSSGPYPKSAFVEMMQQCCKQRMTNVMFLKSGARFV